jgi:carbamoyltransferase
MGTELDVLAIGNCLLKKEQQLPSLKMDYSNAFAPD